MSDATLPQRKYPDEVWWVPVDWTPALDGATIVGTPTVVGVDLTVDAATQDGNITRIKISGGTLPGGSAFNVSARLELLATTSTGEKLGFNLGVPVRPR